MREAMDEVVLPALRRFVEAKLRKFQRDVVDTAAVAAGMSSEAFTDENVKEYRELIHSYMDQPRWDFLEKMTKDERAELLANCKKDGPWRRTVASVRACVRVGHQTCARER